MEGFKKILFYAKDYKNKMYLAIAFMFLSVVMGIVPYAIIAKLVSVFIEDGNIEMSTILYLAIGIGISLYAKTWFRGKGLGASHDVAYDTLMGLRVSFAEKMMKLPLGTINDRGTGAYKKNFVDDIEQIETLIAHMVPEGLPYLMSPLVVIVVLAVVDWRLALLSLGSIPFGIIPIALMMKSGIKKMEKYYESEKEMNRTIVEYIMGMEVIKVFNRTTSSFEKYKNQVEDYRDFTLDWFKSSWTYMAMYTSILPCTIMLLLPIGSLFYINGSLELGTFVFSLLLAMSIGEPLVKLMEFMPNIPNLAYKIRELEKTFEGDFIKSGEIWQEIESYDVSYESVSFAYDKIDVIKGVSFKANTNEVTAIVGESGSGKSTLAKLLVHYWDIDGGSIKIGGVPIANMPMEQLMELVSFVSQDKFLFNIPIIENIRLGRPEASDEEVIKAAKSAQCHDFIMKLENGYETHPGDLGDKLSGGEKQRITIARAILKDSPIIVLDEATSSTDAENEDKIQDAIGELIENKTLIVIAHRLSTVAGAHKMIVLDKGNIVAEGRHDELLKNSPEYNILWKSYARSVEWDISVKEEAYA